MGYPLFRRDHKLAVSAWKAVAKSQSVVQFSTERRIIWCNDAFCELTGYRHSDAIGMHHSALHSAEAADSNDYERLWQKLERGEYDVGEYCMQTRDGRQVRMQATYNPVLNELGAVNSILKIGTDVTETTCERVESAGKLAAIDRSHLVLEIDLAGPITYANGNFLEATGLERKEVIGHALSELVTMDVKDELKPAEFKARLEAGHRVTGFQRIVKPDGSQTLLDGGFHPIFDPGGQLEKLLYIGTDVTDQSNLMRALERAENAAEAKSAFLANMSHEVRTPMAGVMGFAELLLCGELDATQRQQAEMIRDSGEKMMRLLNDILDVSKIEAGQMHIAREPVDPVHKVRSCVELMRPIAEGKGLILHFEQPHDMPGKIVSDALRLRQILLNLIGNAVKFTEEGMVSIGMARDNHDPGKLRIEIVDTGVGIAADRLDVVRSKFVQANHAVAKNFGGTGLGLTISCELARLMDGDLLIESSPDIGTRVELVVPLVEASAQTCKDAGQETGPRDMRRRTDAPRVLVAEDHDINQMLIAGQMAQIGARADIAGNGREALDMVKRECLGRDPYRLVLMDLQMPVMGGLDTARSIRAAGIDALALPIVALTANAYEEDIRDSDAAGMQAHLAKPIEMEKLAAAIERWVPEQLPGGPSGDPDQPVQLPQAGRSPDLAARYAVRRDEVLERLSVMARQDECDAASVEALATMLHKLAGTAGMFGEEELGEIAREYEKQLRQVSREDYRALIADADRAMRDST